jgi:hypothetical protein
MPTPTDLVTDLPADFEVFGQAVATSMADLLGGTSGQILAKNSNTDMDFVWVANDVGDITGITATSPLTGGGTSGAVTVGILSGTTSNLGAVQLSTSTSSTSTSLAATASAVKEAYDPAFTNNFYAGKNKVINGSFDVWQRGTTFTNPAIEAYFADRFYYVTNNSGGSVTLTRQPFTGTDIPVAGAQYYFRNVGASPTGQAYSLFGTKIENVQTFAGQSVTISFYAKADASRTTTPTIYQQFGSGGSTLTTTTGSAITLTTSWARYTQTLSIPSISGKTIGTSSYLQVEFSQPTNTSYTTEFYGIQIEAGSVATPFQTATGTTQGELAACQRYYYRNTATGDVYTPFNYGAATSTARTDHYFQFPVTMRTRPTSVGGANLQVIDLTGNNFAITSLTINLYNAAGANVYTGGATGMTQFRPMMITANNNTSAYIEFNAEL